MVEVITYGDFKLSKKLKTKHQIVLSHTSREVGEYLTSLKFRNGGKYEKLPHYVVTRDARVIKILEPNYVTNFLVDRDSEKRHIIICLENLGWVNKKPLSDTYLNWIGNIYKDTVYERKWRDYFLWHPYTNEQIEKTVELCRDLCEQFSIPKKFSGHNTKIDGIENFEGVVSRSNYNTRFTDLSPAFPFDTFKTKLENE